MCLLSWKPDNPSFPPIPPLPSPPLPSALHCILFPSASPLPSSLFLFSFHFLSYKKILSFFSIVCFPSYYRHPWFWTKEKFYSFNYFQIHKRKGQQLISSPRKHDLWVQTIPVTIGIHNASDVSIHLSIACRSHKCLFLSSCHKGGDEKIPLKTLSQPGNWVRSPYCL